jgi:hypothetical protein
MSTSLSTDGIMMFIGACTVVLADYGRELIKIEHCLDASAVYAYDTGQYRKHVIHLRPTQTHRRTPRNP